MGVLTRRRWIGEALRFAKAEGALLAAMAVASAGAMGFAGLSDMLDEDTLDENRRRGVDAAILAWLRPGPDTSDPAGPAWLDLAMLDLTSLGSIAVLGVITLASGGFLLMRGQRLAASALAAGLAGAIVLSESLKAVFERTRPPEAFRAAEALNSSFPSGHALLATAVYLTLGVLLARAVTRRRLKAYIVGVAMQLAVLVGVSRVYLGVHWTTDVLAGWCVGAVWAALCWIAVHLVQRRAGSPAAEAG